MLVVGTHAEKGNSAHDPVHRYTNTSMLATFCGASQAWADGNAALSESACVAFKQNKKTLKPNNSSTQGFRPVSRQKAKDPPRAELHEQRSLRAGGLLLRRIGQPNRGLRMDLEGWILAKLGLRYLTFEGHQKSENPTSNQKKEENWIIGSVTYDPPGKI
ncbi:hypothetical protein C8J56DRAFT_889582 [Mycena floridula]|nr:hypothetical protein C8J56DRAFT_889582 [Mycena floridula]